MKLIKINTDHYVIVDDSEIKEGDWMYNSDREPSILQCIGKGSLRGWEKITHSTQSLEFGWAQEGRDIVSKKVYDKVQSLSLSEVKELIGEVDVEQYAWDNPVLSRKDVYELFNEVFKDKHIEGAYRISASKQVYQFNAKLRELAKQKALEDNKNKKYTEEDLKKAIEFGYQLRCNNRPINSGHNWAKDFIAQSLQPKTEWEVEYDENGKLKLV